MVIFPILSESLSLHFNLYYPIIFSMQREKDIKFMKEALRLAEKGRGTTSPNPMVGAVVVKGNRVVGRGYHKRAGSPHAEVIALEDAGTKAKGATLYVTLEPCIHYGRTPPCVPRIVSSGIKRVVIAMIDPNPVVKGRGVEMLKKAGIEVIIGIGEEKARELNEFYIKYITRKIPFVILKWAMSLDGKIATFTGDSRWISGEESRKFVHSLRKDVDAVLVGIGTVKKDDPLLTVRLVPSEKQPLRVIIDPQLEISPQSRLLKEEGGKVVIFTLSGVDKEKVSFLQDKGAEVIEMEGERIRIKKLLEVLGKMEVTSLLVEGGEKVFTSFLEEGCVDKVYAIVSPLLLGGKDSPTPFGGKGFEKIKDGLRLKKLEWLRKGEDMIISGYIEVKCLQE